jgi:hypothetical protein
MFRQIKDKRKIKVVLEMQVSAKLLFQMCFSFFLSLLLMCATEAFFGVT